MQFFGSIRRHPRAWTITAASVVFALCGSGALALGASAAPTAQLADVTVQQTQDAASAAPAPTPSASPTAAPRPVPVPSAKASRVRTCSVNDLAGDSRLGHLEAQVVNPKTGEVLFDRDGSTPNATASVMKVLTSAAALSILGPNYQVPTTVVEGKDPGTVVLVGGGDITLTRLPSGQESFYTGAAHLDDLAKQVKTAWTKAHPDDKIEHVVVDASLFGGPVWQPSWDEHEERVVEGSTSYITALQVDGDRNDPTALESSRSTDPIGRASDAFADLLGVAHDNVSDGSAPSGAATLGRVTSQPVSALVTQAVTVSDNTIMEMLARLVAIKTGAGNTFSAENAGTLAGLKAYGIPTTGIHIVDGSGLSNDNAVPPSYLTRLMVKILNREDGLGAIYDALPISGKTGTLAPRYSRFYGANQIAAGKVHAKTGWIDNGYTLAGVVDSQDGTPLTFAVFALGDVRNDAKVAIDTLVTGFYTCGNNLSDH